MFQGDDDIVIKLDGMKKDEMTEILREFKMKSPITENELSDPIEFNLMFSTSIGPTGLVKGFLRPETAQGIFVNFKRLLEFNQVISTFWLVCETCFLINLFVIFRAGYRLLQHRLVTVSATKSHRDRDSFEFASSPWLKLNTFAILRTRVTPNST